MQQLLVGSVADVSFGPPTHHVPCRSEVQAIDSNLDCARIIVADSENAQSLKIQGTHMWVRMTRIQGNNHHANSNVNLSSPVVFHDDEEKREELSAFIDHPLSDVHIPPSKPLSRIRENDAMNNSNGGSNQKQKQRQDPLNNRETSARTDADTAMSISTATTNNTDLTNSTSSSAATNHSTSHERRRSPSLPNTIWDERLCTDFEINDSFIRLKPTDECATCFCTTPVYYDEGGVHVWKVRIDSDSNSESKPNLKSSSTGSGSDICIGISQNREETIHDDFSYEVYGWGYYGIGGVIHCNPDGILGRQVRYGQSFSVHDTVSVILDLDAFTLSFGKNDEVFGVAFDFNAWTEHQKNPPQTDAPFYLAVMIGRAGSATLVDAQHYGVRNGL